ncbi:hypothetical protein OROMI_002205 [Orobanche minor]
MEAMKERKDQIEKQGRAEGKDPMGKGREVIQESIISKKSDHGGIEAAAEENKNKLAEEEPEEILAYSRAVHQKDSLLE